MVQRWNPNNLQDFGKRLVDDPSGAGRDLDQTIQILNRQVNAIPQFADNIIPHGVINGTNASFTLTPTPNPATSVRLFKNGILQTQGTSYRISGNTITYVTGNQPMPGDTQECFYRY